jgi:ribonuclease HI
MIKCWIDGGCAPKNPGGKIGCGVAIEKDGKKIVRTGAILDEDPKILTSNNMAEYLALRAVLRYLIKHNLTLEPITIYSDSKLLINQMWGNWIINSGSYVTYAFQCKKILSEIGVNGNIKGEWIPREQNKEADGLCNEAFIKIGIVDKYGRG